MVSSPDGSHHEIHHSGPKSQGPLGLPLLRAWAPSNEPDCSTILDLDDPDHARPPGRPVGLMCRRRGRQRRLLERCSSTTRRIRSGRSRRRSGRRTRPASCCRSIRRTSSSRRRRRGRSSSGCRPGSGSTDPWQPLQASATLDTVTSTVVATPTSLTFTLDDGTSFSCDGPGTPYDPTRDPADQQSDLHPHLRASRPVVVTATVTYTTTWTATTGAGGDLDDLTRTTTIPITVEEAQALIH